MGGAAFYEYDPVKPSNPSFSLLQPGLKDLHSQQSGSQSGDWNLKTEDLGNSRILNLLLKPAGMLMGSGLRQWLSDPVRTLQGADIRPGQTVLEAAQQAASGASNTLVLGLDRKGLELSNGKE